MQLSKMASVLGLQPPNLQGVGAGRKSMGSVVLSPSQTNVFQTMILSDHCESSGSVVTSAVETVALLQKLKHICH